MCRHPVSVRRTSPAPALPITDRDEVLEAGMVMAMLRASSPAQCAQVVRTCRRDVSVVAVFEAFAREVARAGDADGTRGDHVCAVYEAIKSLVCSAWSVTRHGKAAIAVALGVGGDRQLTERLDRVLELNIAAPGALATSAFAGALRSGHLSYLVWLLDECKLFPPRDLFGITSPEGDITVKEVQPFLSSIWHFAAISGKAAVLQWLMDDGHKWWLRPPSCVSLVGLQTVQAACNGRLTPEVVLWLSSHCALVMAGPVRAQFATSRLQQAVDACVHGRGGSLDAIDALVVEHGVTPLRDGQSSLWQPLRHALEWQHWPVVARIVSAYGADTPTAVKCHQLPTSIARHLRNAYRGCQAFVHWVLADASEDTPVDWIEGVVDAWVAESPFNRANFLRTASLLRLKALPCATSSVWTLLRLAVAATDVRGPSATASCCDVVSQFGRGVDWLAVTGESRHHRFDTDNSPRGKLVACVRNSLRQLYTPGHSLPVVVLLSTSIVDRQRKLEHPMWQVARRIEDIILDPRVAVPAATDEPAEVRVSAGGCACGCGSFSHFARASLSIRRLQAAPLFQGILQYCTSTLLVWLCVGGGGGEGLCAIIARKFVLGGAFLFIVAGGGGHPVLMERERQREAEEIELTRVGDVAMVGRWEASPCRRLWIALAVHHQNWQKTVSCVRHTYARKRVHV